MNPVKAERAIATSERLSSKAAQFTESVIREMTRLALQYGAVNLSQGFPDFAAPSRNQARRAGSHRRGHQSVRHHLGSEIAAQCHRREIRAHAAALPIDPEREITVCCGSTEAMMSVDDGDHQSGR